ncbi:MAG: hypothetical protein IAB91_00220 [Bacteroidetes bacterium]|uniref:Uncharacterized protein n=1 Tax=Candidatus Cryptobacteroides faecigallinarum TaxID=2840763 RepID=A0A9D9NHK0_9BACT|nr:hypothetical protein [Candidatus Cryptobacteroides faecigallinarum]
MELVNRSFASLRMTGRMLWVTGRMLWMTGRMLWMTGGTLDDREAGQ